MDVISKSKLRVFLFSAWYPTEFTNLCGNFVQKHAKAISKFAQVIVIHPYEDVSCLQKQKFTIDEKQIHENFIEIFIKYKGIRNKTYFTKLIRFLRLRKAYQKGIEFAIQKYGKPDISHVNILTRTSFPALRLKRKYKIPFIITEHWSRYLLENETFKGFFHKKITQYAVKQAAAVTSVSSHLKEAMLSHGLYNANYQVVPNVVDTDLFQPSAVEKKKKSILHVSTLNNRYKNFTGILHVINKLTQKRNDFVLDVLHSCDNSAYLPFVEENNLQDVVVFHGQKTGKELVKHFNNADFFVLFSNYENLPCVIIESFACGKPVVSTSVGGIPTLINKNTGILIDVKDEIALENAINYMLDHHQDYDSNAIRNYAVENFSEDAVGKMFLTIYQNVFLR